MFSRTSRPAARCARGQLYGPSKARLQSTTSQSSTSSSPGTNPALVGGLAGGAVAFGLGYAWYHFSGAKTAVRTVKETQKYANSVKQGIVKNAPEPDKALEWFRETTKRYAAFIPGARGTIDTAFDDLEKIREKHGEEFDAIMRDAYGEMRDLTKKGGANMDTAFQALQILQKHLNRLLDLSADAADDILNNHPKLKEKIGGSWDQLKEMGEAYGPQAKEEVNKTWEQVVGIVKKGPSLDAVEEVKKLLQEKREKLQKLGDEAWKKGMEESKEYLDKNPKVKELVENNADALKKANFTELWGLVKESASSGKTEELEKYVKDKVGKAKDTAQSSGIDLDKWSSLVPGGSEILSQLQTLQSLGEKKGKEAEGVLKEAASELQEVLKKRKDQLEKIADEAKQESK
ncbi:hypothetical protein ASPCAL04850 [Aspergillus calidoustus]|uniref:Apolipoprotein/apolipophorin n=1 Tax=Aspergillus calidoustus TaxID=454130 RepID=A0A0U5FZR7_ASPCI|nr:hypothetical protein ASPCAL04850 [Aspergillus calidoustus]